VFYYLGYGVKTMVTVDKNDELDLDELDLLDDTFDDQDVLVQPWRIMVVDDDGEVHQATRFALSGVEIIDRPLSLIHAYSGEEAANLLRQMPDIAVVLLDVVMESDDSGLCLIDLIRHQLAYTPLRIILRTGQLGLAPEAALVAHYDIHDYMLKTEVSRERLVTSLTTAVRTFEQLEQMVQIKQQMLGMARIVSGVLSAKTPANLVQLIVQKLVALYALSPIVAVWHNTNEPLSSAVFMFADAQHRAWKEKKLAELSGDPLLAYIELLLSSARDAQFSDTVFVHGDGWRLVMVLQENNFTQNLIAESWEMFQSVIASCVNHRLSV
jgi:CheY-like chemotaxis protein